MRRMRWPKTILRWQERKKKRRPLGEWKKEWTWNTRTPVNGREWHFNMGIMMSLYGELIANTDKNFKLISYIKRRHQIRHPLISFLHSSLRLDWLITSLYNLVMSYRRGSMRILVALVEAMTTLVMMTMNFKLRQEVRSKRHQPELPKRCSVF